MIFVCRGGTAVANFAYASEHDLPNYLRLYFTFLDCNDIICFFPISAYDSIVSVCLTSTVTSIGKSAFSSPSLSSISIPTYGSAALQYYSVCE